MTIEHNRLNFISAKFETIFVVNQNSVLPLWRQHVYFISRVMKLVGRPGTRLVDSCVGTLRTIAPGPGRRRRLPISAPSRTVHYHNLVFIEERTDTLMEIRCRLSLVFIGDYCNNASLCFVVKLCKKFRDFFAE